MTTPRKKKTSTPTKKKTGAAVKTGAAGRASKTKRKTAAAAKKTSRRKSSSTAATGTAASAKKTKKASGPGKKKPAKLWTRGQSGIHANGLFAAVDIPKGTRVIEYVGHRLTKQQGYERAMAWLEKTRGTDKGAVYVFEVNSRWDIDGNVPWNPARFINHSCRPNCEPRVIRGRIFIIARRNIKAGEELTYDYGYDLEHWEEHPCRCGAPNCIGYIVGREHRAKLRRILRKREAEARAAADSGK